MRAHRPDNLFPRIAAAPVVLLAAACSLASTAALAEVYRWVDADGRVQFGDRPPADAEAEPLDVGSGKSVSGDLDERRERRERLLDVMQEERAEEARADAENDKQESVRRQNCSTASDKLRRIEEARYIYEPTGDPDNPRVLEDQERAGYTAKARQEVSKWCN